MKPIRILTACLLLLPGAFAVSAQSQSGAAQGEYIENVDVNVVNVDVYVTDKSGQRVKGLTKDDFEVFENGKKVAITNFYTVEGGKAMMVEEPSPPAEPGKPAPPVEAQVAPVPEDQRLRLIVYIDNFNLHPFNRNRVMRELRAFLANKLTRGDQVMLVSYDRSLHVRRTFTSDPDLINDALVELEKVSGHAVHHDSERRDVLRNIEDSRSAAEAMSHARSYAQSTFNDLSFSIDALKDFITSLAGMPGRKAILYVSDGLQMIAGQDVYYAVQSKYSEQATGMTEFLQFDASRRFTELANNANANRVTFYTIDAAGLRVSSSISAENQTAGQGIYVDQIQISNLQAPLQMLAEKTGGVAIINANQVTPHLERVAQDFGSYYSLGYTPTHYGDGRYYKIEVKLKQKQKGLQVRHREGYRDKSTESRMSDGTLAVLNFPFEDNKFGVELEFGQMTPRENGHYLVSVLVKIPLGKLVFVPREQTHEGRVRLYIAAMDDKGGTSDVQQVQLPISIPAADVQAAMGKHYSFSVSLLMRRGDQKVAVGVRDDVAGESSFVSRMLRVGTQVSSGN
ncbi:MAG TPA: VWA domain-containing protein [Thermoanaerobaculia bacterium]|nr:VWA domain-containing protein [Thermoanaerobaculia bacterium]